MRRTLFVLAVLAALVVAGRASATTIYLQSSSSVYPETKLADAARAIQDQINLDFAPAWGITATVAVSPAPPAGAWVLQVQDDATIPGALGYHDVCTPDGHGVPCGYVFAQTAIDYKTDPATTIDHELLEMLGDPYVTTMVRVGSRFYIQEVCDAPEDFTYERDGIPLSDFVTPEWFRPGHVGPYDHLGLIHKPLQLLAGGYISYWQYGSWHQTYGRRHRRSHLAERTS